MPSATKVLNIARSQLGYRAASGNRNKFGRWYGMDGVSWCDMFVSWVAVQAGAKDIIGRAAYTPTHADWFRANGRWGHTPRRGAIAFFNWPSDGVDRIQHVGFVESVRSSSYVVTVEGNTSNGLGGSQSNGGGVWRRVRNTSTIVGYGYPDYGTEKTVTRMPDKGKGGRPPLTVDGVWGRNTTRALQRFLGVEDDGQIGANTRRALQKYLGTAVDGTWGRAERKGLQKKLGVTVDGDWGPKTIKALQRRLNSDWRK